MKETHSTTKKEYEIIFERTRKIEESVENKGQHFLFKGLVHFQWHYPENTRQRTDLGTVFGVAPFTEH